MTKVARLWPHRLEGEGHFVSFLQKKGNADSPRISPLVLPKGNPAYSKIYEDFVRKNLTLQPQGVPLWHDKSLFLLPCEIPDLSGIRVLKFCWYIGQIEREEFEPSHSLVCALSKNSLQKTIDFAYNSEEITRYIRGESLKRKGEKGLVGVCMDGYTLSWGKYSADMLKNLYPKGWRKMS